MKNKEEEIKILLQGEDTAQRGFSIAVREYSEQLYWQIRRMVTDHDDANDVLQNTFLKAWTNLSSFRGEAKFSTWLYRIAINECFSFLNKRKSDNLVSMDADDSYEAQTLEGEAYFDGEEAQQILQDAVESLPPKQRIVFVMKYFEERKYEEMSELLGTSVGALKASFFHAVRKIEQYVEDRN
jgi:RNA polymerase sigma-70 factor (ECF subfamily)